MRKILQSSLVIALAISVTGSMTYAMQPTKVKESHNEKSIVASIQPPKKSDVAKVEQEPAPATETAPVASETVVLPPAPAPVQDNETIVWNFLIAQGFTREQAAGIMGNLQQEHNFRTDGDGLAQWTDNRKAALMALENNQDITVQLNFLMQELNTYESNSKAAIIDSATVEQATQMFQDKFERCNPYYCHLNQRINYAYAILNRH